MGDQPHDFNVYQDCVCYASHTSGDPVPATSCANTLEAKSRGTGSNHCQTLRNGAPGPSQVWFEESLPHKEFGTAIGHAQNCTGAP